MMKRVYSLRVQNAVMPDDFNPPFGFGVTFPAAGLSGDTTQCATIPTTDDEVLEGDHDFMVMLDSVTPDVVTIGNSLETATLLDNESKLCFKNNIKFVNSF